MAILDSRNPPRALFSLLAAVAAIGCEDDQWAGNASGTVQRAPQELLCPLPELSAPDPGPLPEHDPFRAAQTPALFACELPARTMQRLNRTEYANAVRDLFGLPMNAAAEFPLDDTSEGFDNQGDALSTAPVLIEKLLRAAEVVTDRALDKGEIPAVSRVWEAEQVFGEAEEGATVHRMMRNGGRFVPFDVDVAGTYRFHARAYGEQAGGQLVQMGFRLDDAPLTTFDVEGSREAPVRYTTEAFVTTGEHVFSLHYLNEYFRPENNDDPGLDRNLVLDYIEIEGPFGVFSDEIPAARTALVTCDPEELGATACAQEILARVGRIAFRRPLTSVELARLTGFVTQTRASGGDFDEALKAGLRAILVSPQFLYKIERDPSETDDTPHLLDDHALATRLASFLWSSIPDDRLLTLAERGALNDPLVLAGEAHRMLDDPKSSALVSSFAGQWFLTRAVDDVIVDGMKNPGVDRELLRAMRCETELVFDEILRKDAPITELLLADYTYVNQRLAQHYGIDAPVTEPARGAHPQSGFTRVSLASTERQGLLTHASVLAKNAHPTRTSPVLRGKFVLDQVLCIPPEPPPPMVEGLPETVPDATTLRDLLAEHRENVVCAGCHNAMDPIGLALENFDELGRYRTEDNGIEIDASALFMGHLPVDGPKDIAAAVANDPLYPECVVEKSMVYALGRAFTDDDKCAQDAITAAAADGLTFRDVLVNVVLSAPFRMRRATPEDTLVDDASATSSSTGDSE
jgi:hypothetical protein